MSALACRAASLMRLGGPTRIGAISPSRAASTAPSIEIRSQGCATAVVTGGNCFAARRSRLYRSRGSVFLVSIDPPFLGDLRRLVPADLWGRTSEHRLDAFEPAAALSGKGAPRRKHPAHQRQCLVALPAIAGQQLRKRRNRPLRV